MLRYKKSVVAVLILFWGRSTYAMVYDNRFLPLIKPPYITVFGRHSYADVDLFITTADSAFGDNDQELGIPELFGRYDENQLAQAIARTGKPNPLIEAFPTDIDLLLAELPWRIGGKIQTQGMSFAMRKTLGLDWLSIGFSWLFMRVNSGQNFRANFNEQVINSEITIAELDQLRRSMETEIGLSCAHSHQVGMGDLDLYLRAGNEWEYVLKCRCIRAGLSVGALVPTGERRDINVAASIPFGGNGHPGFYFSGDLELELKEDLKVGLLLRGSKRSPRICVHRMPACKEPQLFGAIVGRARVNPAGTLVFSPYIMMENLRDGFGAMLQYTLIDHGQDGWIDLRRDRHTIPANIKAIEEYSSWRSSYVTLYAFYDFGKMKVEREFDPIFTFAWDVPVGVCDAHSGVKTQKVALGFEFNF